METGQPYAYAGDDPVNGVDPDGRMVNQGPEQPIAGNSSACAVAADKIDFNDQVNGKLANYEAYETQANESDPFSSIGHLAVSVERFAVDLPQDAFYPSCWGNYEVASQVVKLGCSHGTAACAIAHALALPLVPAEAVGLAGDVAGNALKGEPLAQGENPNTPLLGNDSIFGVDVGRDITNDLGLPTLSFPGYDARTHNIQIAW